MTAYLPEGQTQEHIDDQTPISPASKSRQPVQQPKPSGDSGGGRKKNSFEDDDESELCSGGLSSSTYVKKEYYLKGGDGMETMRMAASVATCGIEQTVISQQTGSTSNTLPKSNLKGD